MRCEQVFKQACGCAGMLLCSVLAYAQGGGDPYQLKSGRISATGQRTSRPGRASDGGLRASQWAVPQR